MHWPYGDQRRRLWLLCCTLVIAGFAGFVQAAEPVLGVEAGYQRIDAFMRDLKGLDAQFRQVLRDSRGQVAEQSSGTLAILRPDRFRWEYASPNPQLIVSDGSRLWLYDRDLEQVTVRRFDQSLAGTPATLLSGSGDLRASFDVERVEQRGDVFWVVLAPKRQDTDFKRVRLGFRKEALAYMELEDKLNQTTTLEFTRVERNPRMAPDRFVFTPPPAADVIGDATTGP